MNAALLVAVVHAVIARTRTARLNFLLAHGVLLCQFPIGTVLASLGLILHWGSRELWGVDRITHRQIDAEYDYRLRKYGYDHDGE